MTARCEGGETGRMVMLRLCAAGAAQQCTLLQKRRYQLFLYHYAHPTATKTKICDTPRARKIDPHPLIVTMLHCPRTKTCRMHPVYSRNWKEVVVNNAHLHTLAPQVEVAIALCGGVSG
eukprot:SAG25_NODE_1461_length_2970_cov_1.601881_3_plen_119_part_00